MRALMGKLALAAASGVLALAAAEGGFRLWEATRGGPPAAQVEPGDFVDVASRAYRVVSDERLLYDNAPCPACADPVSEEGFRGLSPKSRDAVAWRAAIIGDSVAFGSCVHGREAFAARLEGKLNGRAGARGGKPVEVINAGVPGYNFPQIHATYTRKLAALRPEAVIYAFFVNDFLPQKVVIEPGNRPTVMLVSPELPQFSGGEINLLWSAAAETSALEPRLWAYLRERWRRREFDAWYREKPLLTVARVGARLIQALAAEVERDGGRFAVALVPQINLRTHGGTPYCLPGEFFSTCETSRETLHYMKHLGAQTGAVVWDLSGVYDGLTLTETQCLPHDPNHPSAAGHDAIAARLFEHLEGSGWLPAW